MLQEVINTNLKIEKAEPMWKLFKDIRNLLSDEWNRKRKKKSGAIQKEVEQMREMINELDMFVNAYNRKITETVIFAVKREDCEEGEPQGVMVIDKIKLEELLRQDYSSLFNLAKNKALELLDEETPTKSQAYLEATILKEKAIMLGIGGRARNIINEATVTTYLFEK